MEDATAGHLRGLKGKLGFSKKPSVSILYMSLRFLLFKVTSGFEGFLFV